MKYRWVSVGYFTEAYLDETGKVVGEISSCMGWGFFAEVNEKTLGKYHTEDQAKKAVEKKIGSRSAT